MSQSRFSIVLVGVSALLRRPLVSRLRPADGERSSWVVFAARVGRFDSGFRSAGWPRAHCFRFSACTASEWPLGEFVLPPSASEIALGGLAFGLTASAFRHAPLRRLPPGEFVLPPSGSEIATRQVGLRAHCFRFLACTDSEIALGGLVLPLGGLAFGFTASAFRHALFRSCRSAGWPSGSLLPLFGMHRFGVAVRRVALRAHCFRFSARTDSEIALGGLAFGLTASAFRHALLRRLPSAG